MPSCLQVSAARSRPVTGAESQLLEVPGALTPLFPEGGIRRGSTVAIAPISGGASVALLMAGMVSRTGGSRGGGYSLTAPVAAAGLGVRLDRLVLVPFPGPQWPAVVASLLDGVDLLLLDPGGGVRAGEARRLARRRARRARDGDAAFGRPPLAQSPDIRLAVSDPVWTGLGRGYGQLESRRLEVASQRPWCGGEGRGRGSIWLPTSTGAAEYAGPQEEAVADLLGDRMRAVPIAG